MIFAQVTIASKQENFRLYSFFWRRVLHPGRPPLPACPWRPTPHPVCRPCPRRRLMDLLMACFFLLLLMCMMTFLLPRRLPAHTECQPTADSIPGKSGEWRRPPARGRPACGPTQQITLFFIVRQPASAVTFFMQLTTLAFPIICAVCHATRMELSMCTAQPSPIRPTRSRCPSPFGGSS